MPEVLDVAGAVPLRDEEAEVDVAAQLNRRLVVAHQRLRLREPLLERGVVEDDPRGLIVVLVAVSAAPCARTRAGIPDAAASSSGEHREDRSGRLRADAALYGGRRFTRCAALSAGRSGKPQAEKRRSAAARRRCRRLPARTEPRAGGDVRLPAAAPDPRFALQWSAERSPCRSARVLPSVTSGCLALASMPRRARLRREGPLSDEEMALLRGFTLPPPARPIRRMRPRTTCPRRIDWASSCFSIRAYSGKLGPYNVAEDERRARERGRRGQGVVRVLPRPADAGVDHRSIPNATSLGASYTARNAPTVINAAYSPLWQFWDGRADSLWSQALAPPGGRRRVQRQPARRRARSRRQVPLRVRLAFSRTAARRRSDALPDPRSAREGCAGHEGRGRHGSRAVRRRVRLHAPTTRRPSTGSTPTSARRSPRTSGGWSARRSIRRRSTLFMAGDDGRDVAGGDPRRAAVRRPRRLRRVPPRADVHRFRLPQHRRAAGRRVRAADRRRPRPTASSRSRPIATGDSRVHAARRVQRPARRLAYLLGAERDDARRVGRGAVQDTDACATSPRPRRTCTTASTRRCGTS